MFNNANNVIGGIRHSTGSNTGPFETYTNYMIRLRGSNSTVTATQNNSAQRANITLNSALGNNSTTNPINPPISIDRTTRASMRYRAQRRPHLIERIRNMHEPRYPTPPTNNSNNTGTSNVTPIMIRRQPILRYEAPSYIPITNRVVANDPRSTLGMDSTKL